MSYIVLARKYRPFSFSEVIGQEHISRTLINALKFNKLAHAYIFSGPRGVGKTTMARILAKSLNCVNANENDPCNECPVCVEINKGSFIDIMEIDGASNRGIDEIRTLRDNVKFTPVSGKYKVYIIDEAHQITADAYNALLKTIEEPPAHVLFILATTDPHKIPITIFSRCQRFVFRPLNDDEIIGHLKVVAEKEGISVEPGALELTSSASSGSMRDALSLLDQVISFSRGSVKVEDVRYLLGYLPDELIASIMKGIASHKPGQTLSLLDKVFRQGHDLLQLAKNLLDCFHELLLIKSGCGSETNLKSNRDLLDSLKGSFGEEEIIRDIELLDRAVTEMRRTGEYRLILQVYLYKIAMNYISMEDILQKLDNAGQCAPSNDDEDAGEMNLPTQLEKEEGFGLAVKNQDDCDSGIDALWKKTVQEVDRVKPSLTSSLKNCGINMIEENVWEICFPSRFDQTQFERNKDVVEEKAAEVTGKPGISLRVKVRENSNSCQEPSDIPGDEMGGLHDSADRQVEEVLAARNDPGVKKVLDMFGGRINSVISKKRK